MATIKFWSEMTKATTVDGEDKVMIGRNATGEAMYADFQYLINQAGMNSSDYIPVDGNTLPDGGEGNKVTFAAPGTYTQSGGDDVVVPENSLGIITWDGDEWSLGSSVLLESGKLDSGGYQGSAKDLDDRLIILEKGGALVYLESDFTVPASYSGYVKTEPIDLSRFKYAYMAFQGRGSSVSAAFVYNSSGDVVKTFDIFRYTYFTPATDQFFYAAEIEEDWKSLEVMTRSLDNVDYDSRALSFVIVGNNKDTMDRELLKFIEPNLNTFNVEGHAYSANDGYNSIYPTPYVEGLSFYYDVDSKNLGGAVLENMETRITLPEGPNVTDPKGFGLISFSTFNDSHDEYDPEFTPLVDASISGEGDYSNLYAAQSRYLPGLSLKATRDVFFLDGTPRLTIQYLWMDANFNFFLSSDRKGAKNYIFSFDPSDFGGASPHDFSMGFDNMGNILCVFRIEQLSVPTPSDSNRRNPYVLIKNKNYTPVEVDFGEGLKPSGWLQNCGFLCTEDYVMLTEYTRASVETANTWKAVFPLTDPNNWKVVQTFDVDPLAIGFKHIHNIDIDPYTGIIYTSTGDVDVAAYIYASVDGGDSFFPVVSESEKRARVLNWVFTEDYIYWATDSTGSKHWLFRCPRDSSGLISENSIEELIQFPSQSRPTYASIYFPALEAILFLGRADGVWEDLPVDLYDLTSGSFKTIDTLHPVDNTPQVFGFRCECFEYVPRGLETICGFSVKLGPGGYENSIGILGNKQPQDGKINNIIINLNRIGEEFKITYSTEVL